MTQSGGGTTEQNEMPMRVLGNTGMLVSVLGLGFWATYGTRADLLEQEGINKAKTCMRVARDAGINLFDNAETYGQPRGAAELVMGEALRQLTQEEPHKWRRSELILTTKLMWGGTGANEQGLSRKHVCEGMEGALKRLQVEYVDLVFCHRPDPLTPTETVVRAMTDLVHNGKAMAWGTSDWSAQQITEAFWIARHMNMEPPAFEQPQYNMYTRDKIESEYTPLFHPPYNLGTTIWSPLAEGLLTGKYNKGTPADSRLASDHKGFSSLEEWRATGKIEAVTRLTEYANDKLGCSMTQLAIAWCIKNKNVSTALLGCSKLEQLEHNLGAIAVARKLTDDHMEMLDKMLGSAPAPYVGFGCSRLPDYLPPECRRPRPTF